MICAHLLLKASILVAVLSLFSSLPCSVELMSSTCVAGIFWKITMPLSRDFPLSST